MRVDDLEAFEAVAVGFASELHPGDVVALEGELGAGKTTFVAAIVRALHGRDETTSPTFTFRHTYPGAPPLEHLDLYRLEEPSEAVELGLEDAFGPESIAFVEWAERLPGILPPGALRVRIRGSGDAPRELEIFRPEQSRQ